MTLQQHAEEIAANVGFPIDPITLVTIISEIFKCFAPKNAADVKSAMQKDYDKHGGKYSKQLINRAAFRILKRDKTLSGPQA